MAHSSANPVKNHSASPVQQRRQWAVEALRQAQEQAGMTVLIEGLAGMGKTCLLRELRTAALDDGRWSLVVVHADEFEVGEPYSFIERIVAASGVTDWYFEPGSLTDPIAVARECIRRLFGNGSHPGRVFLIDDAQWIDHQSHRVLRYLIPRITRRQMFLAFSARTPHESGSFGEFLQALVADSHLDTSIHLGPLDAHAVSCLIAERHGAVVGPAIAQQIVDETEGSFLEIDSIVSGLTPQDVEQLQLGWQSPTRVGHEANGPLLREFKGLDRASQATAELISVAGHVLTRTQIEAAAEILDEPVHLDRAIEAGVITESHDEEHFHTRHALLAEAISESLAPERARALYRALAEVTDGYRSLRHRLLGATHWDAQLQTEVRRYASVAASERKFGSANEVLRAALKLVTEPAARIELVETLALLHLQARTGYLVLDLLPDIEQQPPNLLRHLLAQILSAHRVGVEVSPRAMKEILATAPTNADEATILGFFAFMVVLLSMRKADTSAVPGLIERARTLVAAAPASGEELTDSRLAWMVDRDGRLLVLDCYSMVQDQQQGDLDAVIARLPALIARIDRTPDSPLKVDALVAIAGAQVAIGRADLARVTAEQSVEILERVGEPWAAGTARVILGHCMILGGELRAAVELMELTEAVTHSALDVETRFGWAALRLMVSAIAGHEDTDFYVEAARRYGEIDWEGYSPDLGVIAECELARVRGDHAETLRLTSPEAIRGFRSTQHGFLTYRALALIEHGEVAEAQHLIAQLGKWRGKQWQEYWGSLDWLNARLAQAEGDLQTARWHFQSAVEHRNYPLQHGLALADYGRFLAQQGEDAEAQEVVHSATAILAGIGADGYLPRVRELADSVSGGSTRHPEAQRLLDRLTERERQVAEQLAKGRSNPQIADSLVVSVATVRSHISNILRKLGLSSRAEVARLIGEPRKE
ncbi:helix-turn-helix transcriptional regulator [Gulosibacter chungangensis]|uniref:AAA family ATPase n=1 Tax=Gulosibacter chungangensis TaxID=979746 RepID=A0A7J5BAG1_9MICO|nr:helix-turn-helix transcriptional regulator [Gulosibacter chungangensis]KAB1643099.1 AAA family ATPase [Gulosibacter chungangensis]